MLFGNNPGQVLYLSPGEGCLELVEGGRSRALPRAPRSTPGGLCRSTACVATGLLRSQMVTLLKTMVLSSDVPSDVPERPGGCLRNTPWGTARLGGLAPRCPQLRLPLCTHARRIPPL